MRLFVITHKTRDYGLAFVVREWRDGIPCAALSVTDTLEEARGAIESHLPSLCRLERSEFDDPVIVESWGSLADVKACRAALAYMTTLSKIGLSEDVPVCLAKRQN